MDQITKQKLILELVWLVATVIIIVAVLAPIYMYTIGYDFYYINALYIFLLVTLFRYTFFTIYTPLEKAKYVKFALSILFIPFTFYLIGEINGFREYIESMGNVDIMRHLDYDMIEWLNPYIRSEMLFSASGAIILSALFPITMVVSVWKQRNRR